MCDSGEQQRPGLLFHGFPIATCSIVMLTGSPDISLTVLLIRHKIGEQCRLLHGILRVLPKMLIFLHLPIRADFPLTPTIYLHRPPPLPCSPSAYSPLLVPSPSTSSAKRLTNTGMLKGFSEPSVRGGRNSSSL